ncbi:tetratricopeptide repeat protein [Kitasatospora sp. CB02891]|uniref:tetratricopeptide repeat protein n=1 Tax=Kitasatospora sp. CB02891 TaxID=2020329 RepID=UPI0012FE08F3|nr:tetratricopeptide repeat protein [Kitasatospora sp. CB02891]
MERSRLVGVGGPGGPGSGCAVGGRLVLTSAHVVHGDGPVEVFRPAGAGPVGAEVLWCGTPGGRDDAALLLVDESLWSRPPGPVRWGRLVTDRPGTPCETWGLPDLAQRAGRPAEAVQLVGEVNPGTDYVGNRHVMDLRQRPPQWSAGSPWGGLSGAAVHCGDLLVGVVAAERAHSGGAQLNLVPGYVLHHDPAFRAVLAAHGVPAAALEPVELQHLADPAVGPERAAGPVRSPAALLRAARQVVPFHGRTELLGELVEWCERGGFGAWLLHGPGGQGKTRLAHELAARLSERQWAVLWPRPDAGAEELTDCRLAARPLLIVLDYAEHRTAQLAALVAAAAAHRGPTAFKLLLLARTDGDWWQQAVTADDTAQDHLEYAPTRRLDPLQDEPAGRPAAYRAALDALAAALPFVDGQSGPDWPGVAATLPIAPNLDQPGYGNALTLQMAALADLLDTTGTAGFDGRPGAAAVEDRLLGHERRYWQRTATALGLSPALSVRALDAVVAAANLAGAADREQADLLWRHLPALADRSRDRRDTVTAWLGALYPAPAPRPFAPLPPDRLAERHIARVLDTDPALPEHLLPALDAPRTAHLLTVYTRAAAHPAVAGRLDAGLTALCVRQRATLAPYFVFLATRSRRPGPLLAALEAIVSDPGTPLAELSELSRLFPDSSQILVHEAARLARVHTDRLRVGAATDPDGFGLPLATTLNELSVRLSQLGRVEESLTAIQEAVELYRTFAAADPERHAPGLAAMLGNLADRLTELGRPDEGLTFAREAIELHRARGEAGLPELADALVRLSTVLGGLGRHEGGLAAVQEALTVIARLADSDPWPHLERQAAAMTNLTIRLGDLGRLPESAAAARRTVAASRALAEFDPDAHLSDLAGALGNESQAWRLLRRPDQGLAPAEEATALLRRLADGNPDAHLPRLRTVLTTLADHLHDLGRQAEALAVAREAVAIARTLHATSPDTNLPYLAHALVGLSRNLGEQGRVEEGATVAQEAVELCRPLSALRPTVHAPRLAVALDHLARHLQQLGREEEALDSRLEAVALLRALDAPAQLPQLAAALDDLAELLRVLGGHVEAVPVWAESVTAWYTLAESDPRTRLPRLAAALIRLSEELRLAGDRDSAIRPARDALDLCRSLDEAIPGHHLPLLATALTNLADCLDGPDQLTEGLALAEEATALRRTLAATDPDAHLPLLAHALIVLATTLGMADRAQHALDPAREAVGICRELHRADPGIQLSPLAAALRVLAVVHLNLGHRAEARDAAHEALALHRGPAAGVPAEFDRVVAQFEQILAEIDQLPS